MLQKTALIIKLSNLNGFTGQSPAEKTCLFLKKLLFSVYSEAHKLIKLHCVKEAKVEKVDLKLQKNIANSVSVSKR